jgi:hypothetical protein
MIYTKGEARKLWIEALRSGKYGQTNGTLENEDGYCCLGVACMAAKQHGVNVIHTDEGFIWGSCLSRQKAVLEWLGLANGTGCNKTQFALVDLNDREQSSFNDIANFIESNPKGLFITETKG